MPQYGRPKGAVWGGIQVESDQGLENGVKIRRSARARRMSLRISSVDHGVRLTVPSFVSDRSAIEFIAEKRGWIERHLNKLPDRIRVSSSPRLPFEGKEFDVVFGNTKSVRLDVPATQFLVPSDPGKRNSALMAFYRLAARDRLVAASDRYAEKLGVAYSRISLRDTRSRWGSCSSGGGLMYSWRLVLAPPAVLDYVAAHEVTHLRHMHHGPEFWQTVELICPDMDTHRHWLREYGVSLHRWDFTD